MEQNENGEGACARVRELLPLEPSGALSSSELQEVAEHLAECDACREEAALLALLRRVRPASPDILVPLILKKVEAAARQRRQRKAWGLRAAAAVILALGVGAFWNSRSASMGDDMWSMALHEDQVAMSWSGGEWISAGQPLWDELPDEVLLALLGDEGGL